MYLINNKKEFKIVFSKFIYFFFFNKIIKIITYTFYLLHENIKILLCNISAFYYLKINFYIINKTKNFLES